MVFGTKFKIVGLIIIALIIVLLVAISEIQKARHLRDTEAKRQGKIAFVKGETMFIDPGGQIVIGSIWIMDYDGKNQIQLTEKESLYPLTPSWRPDGEKIAFVSKSKEDMKYGINIMDPNGKNRVRLNTGQVAGWEFPWSPDGKKIVFTSNRDGNWDIYVMAVDEQNLQRLTNNSSWNGFSRWSPDGKKIAFLSDRDINPKIYGNYELYVMEANGDNQTRLTYNGGMKGYIHWASNSKITFSLSRKVNEFDHKVITDNYVIDVGGKNETKLNDNEVISSSCCVSPDGKKIAFGFVSRKVSKNKIGIYVKDVDGQNQTQLTHGDGMMPAWQPRPNQPQTAPE